MNNGKQKLQHEEYARLGENIFIAGDLWALKINLYLWTTSLVAKNVVNESLV